MHCVVFYMVTSFIPHNNVEVETAITLIFR